MKEQKLRKKDYSRDPMSEKEEAWAGVPGGSSGKVTGDSKRGVRRGRGSCSHSRGGRSKATASTQLNHEAHPMQAQVTFPTSGFLDGNRFWHLEQCNIY